MTELNNCCGTTCDKAALAAETAELRQTAANRTKEAELAKRTANELQQRKDELAAQVDKLISALGRLHEVAACVDGWESFPQKELDFACDALMATPAQCLAEIKAEAVEKAADILSIFGKHFDFGHYIKLSDLREYANTIRNQGGK